jgi:hypothetical protein
MGVQVLPTAIERKCTICVFSCLLRISMKCSGDNHQRCRQEYHREIAMESSCMYLAQSCSSCITILKYLRFSIPHEDTVLCIDIVEKIVSLFFSKSTTQAISFSLHIYTSVSFETHRGPWLWELAANPSLHGSVDNQEGVGTGIATWIWSRFVGFHHCNYTYTQMSSKGNVQHKSTAGLFKS